MFATPKRKALCKNINTDQEVVDLVTTYQATEDYKSNFHLPLQY